MTLQAQPPTPPDYPDLPAPSGYAWGQKYIDVQRIRQHLRDEHDARVADYRVQLTHARTVAALEREAELYEALAERDRRIRAVVALDAPTLDVPVVPSERADQSEDVEPRSDIPEPLTALERAKRYYLSRLDAGETPTADEVAAAVNCSRGYIKRGKHLDPWHAEWKANR